MTFYFCIEWKEQGSREPCPVGRDAILFEEFCVQLKMSISPKLNGQVHDRKFATSQIPTVVYICDTLNLGFVSVHVIVNAF
jgi:hypothetical protein